MRGAAIATVVERTCKMSVTSTRPLPGGNYKETFLARTEEGARLVVQFGPGQMATEAAIIGTIASQTTVPTPRVIGSGEFQDRTYLITEYVPGTDLAEALGSLSTVAREQVARSLGRYLAILHRTFTFEGHGDISQDGSVLVVEEPNPWPAAFRRLVDQGLEELPDAFDDIKRDVAVTLDYDALPRTVPGRLHPWDYRPGNIRYHNGEITGVLDWGSLQAADREFSLTKAEYCFVDWFDVEAGREPFYAGYTAAFPLTEGFTERRPVYRLLAIVRSCVDRHGAVTRPNYPLADVETAVTFHRSAMADVLDGSLQPVASNATHGE